jgi:hypothetical protein
MVEQATAAGQQVAELLQKYAYPLWQFALLFSMHTSNGLTPSLAHMNPLSQVPPFAQVWKQTLAAVPLLPQT